MAHPQQVFAPGRDDRRQTLGHAHTSAEHAALVQSRETGDVFPEDTLTPRGQVKALPFAKSWVHFMAGGIGGMTAATLTAPLDVLKTRLQSDIYQAQLRAAQAMQTQAAVRRGPVAAAFYHLGDTLQILRGVQRTEGTKALFKGLGPNLIGVVPARAINFYVYGNGKRILAERWNGGEEAPWVHMLAAGAAGIATSTATNPIWMIKTRMQLDKNVAQRASDAAGAEVRRRYRNSYDCVRQILREEGVRGLYKGMSASYLGVAESTLQWVLYEQFKAYLARREQLLERSGRQRTAWDRSVEWTGNFGAAGVAKFIAAILAYPHEVARTRLRQAPVADGRPKYTGLVQCFKLVWKEEGLMGLYGGLTPHLLRTVPSAAIMFAMYEGILRLCNTPA
ncbi:putative carrier [Beauveria bassiana D1-5]|uniref:Putative carrier n=1 Tax=Beauveria bassiana D1-5 TaxID=1245745 RepID=A0A0A2VI17_BEABA|nr:putative carrier [Beauveria bassiana D1-5]